MSWTCDGVPKDGKDYPQAIPGGHPPHDNTGPDCMICGLPQEAMQPARGGVSGPTTVVSTAPSTKAQKSQSQWLIPAAIAIVVLVVAGGGYAAWKLLIPSDNNTETSSTSSTSSSPSTAGKFISDSAKNSDLISQGEKTLIDFSPNKQQGETAFKSGDWDAAVDAYQKAVDQNPNDPESKIYLNNAKAQQQGNPVTIAVVLPISNDKNAAKEVLRGVAKAQEDFQNNASGSLLQVVIADDPGGLDSKSLAEDLVNAKEVLGVIGHGIDPFSEEAIKQYEAAGIAILSPRTISVTDGSQPTLKVISMDTKDDELLGNYLSAVGRTLSSYAGNKKAVIFYNSDSSYSNNLKEDIVKEGGGKIIKEIDIKSGLDVPTEIANAKKSGAQVAFLALDKGKVTEAVAIAKENFQSGSALNLLGGDQLYGPEILVQGGDAIKGVVLAVPWSFEASDPFALDAIKSWRGKVSWRTATAYDATQVLGEVVSQKADRAEVLKTLEGGYPMKNHNTEFNIFNEVPLVEAKKGPNHPPNSEYEFTPL